MVSQPPLDSATNLLNASNVLYIVGAVCTALTAAWVVYETRAVALGKQAKHYLLSEFLGALSAFICVMGSVGAIHYGNVVSHLKDDDLAAYQKQADERIATAGSNAAQAIANAADAQVKADKARSNAEEARAKAEGIRAAAEQARKGSLKAEADAQSAVIDKEKILNDNLQLQKQVEDERLARVQIEQRLAPRNFNPAAQNSLVSLLKKIPPHDIDFVSYTGDAEAQLLMSEIMGVFQQVNWKTFYYSPMSGSARGVYIEYDPKDADAATIVNDLIGALQSCGISAGSTADLPPMNKQLGAYSMSDGATGAAKVRIFVGVKM